MLYEYSERFIMPLSHDEVVHLKGSLLQQDAGRRMAEAREPAAAARVHVHAPGQEARLHGHRARAVGRVESRRESRLASRATSPTRAAFVRFVARLAHAVQDERRRSGARTRRWDGFNWIDVADRENSVSRTRGAPATSHAIVVLNLTPVPRERYRVGVPTGGRV